MGYLGRTPTPSPIDASDIPANSIDASKIVDGSIELAEIADNSITDAKLNSSKLDGIETGATNYIHPTTHATADIADNAITEAKIADAAVVSLKSGRKNLIINGGFDVWQRGTSGTGNGYASADRWYVNRSGGSTTFSQQSFTSGQTDVPDNPKYFGRLTVSTGNDNCGFQLRLEDHTLLANRDVTFSFWAKSATPRILRVTAQSYGSTLSVTSAEQTFTPTSAWVKYSFTFNIGSIATVSGTTLLTRMSINQGADTSTAAWELDLANVQLELGSVATDFEHRSYGEELALCQRYYWQMQDDGTTAQFIMTGLNSSFTQVSFYPPVPFRVKPTIGVTDTTPYWESYPWNSIGTTMTISSVSNGHFNKYGGEFGISATFSPTPTRGTNYTVDAEVFTFDAEL